MYKYGVFSKFADGRIECVLEGVDFSFDDMSNATKKYIIGCIKNGLSGGPIFEICYPSDECPKEDLQVLLERRKKIKNLLQQTDESVYEVRELKYELAQIEDILDDYTIHNIFNRNSRLLFVGYAEDSSMAEKQIVYCNCHENRDETYEEIMNAITSDFLIGKFDEDVIGCENIGMLSNIDYVDFSRTYITNHIDAGLRVWEVCGKVTDMVDAKIPHAYYVRNVGVLIESTERTTE